jgi:hypothetical protein
MEYPEGIIKICKHCRERIVYNGEVWDHGYEGGWSCCENHKADEYIVDENNGAAVAQPCLEADQVEETLAKYDE